MGRFSIGRYVARRAYRSTYRAMGDINFSASQSLAMIVASIFCLILMRFSPVFSFVLIMCFIIANILKKTAECFDAQARDSSKIKFPNQETFPLEKNNKNAITYETDTGKITGNQKNTTSLSQSLQLQKSAAMNPKEIQYNGYCFVCKGKKIIVNQKKTSISKRHAVQGECISCNSPVFKLLIREL